MKCKSYFSKWKITEYVWRSLRIYIAHKMSRRKWVGGSSQTFKASSSSNLCSLGHTSLHAKPTQLGWGPWRSCFCLWTISPSERPSLQGSSPLSLCRLSKSMASFAWESSAWCNGRLESLRLEMGHRRGYIDQEQSGLLALLGSFPQGSRHFLIFEGQC